VPAASDSLIPIRHYRKLFPVVRSKAWLNHASQGTLSDRVVKAVADFAREHAEGGLSVESEGQLYARVRGAVARFINAHPSEIAFTKNVPDALNIVAHGLAWAPRNRVIVSDQEFPANVYPWLNLVSTGVEAVVVPSKAGRVPIEAVIDALDYRTRLVALSWVEFYTGYRNDIRAIADACHEAGALLCVDAIQGLGAIRFDVRKLDVDMVATSSHKWLLGPAGVGWMYCRRELLDQLGVCFIGQNSVERTISQSFLDYERPLWRDARKFESGVHNQLGLVGLEASLSLLTEVGMERIEARIKELSGIVAAGLADRGYKVIGTRQGDQWSGIVSFASDTFSAEDLRERLASANVVVSLRESVVRVCTHFYNDEEDIARLFRALPPRG
jgi:selenocysteine lyase/cysteine desulfurase